MPNPRADLAGIERGGYKVVYTDKPTASARTIAATRRGAGGGDFWYSLGMRTTADGLITDIRWDGVADHAHLGQGDKLVGINGQVATPDVLKEALKKAKNDTAPIHLIVQAGSILNLVDLNYHDGERYPSMVRDDAKPDLLDEITKPLSPATVLPKPHEPPRLHVNQILSHPFG